MSNYIITADTTFELSPQQVEQLGIVPIVSYVSLGDEMLDDFPDINASDVFAYVKKSGNAKITIAKKTGKVTVKKGLKQGTYKVKVKVKAAGTANYKASAWKVVTFTVTVR